MALIGQIRKRGSWVLIILIGLGLGGFIVQDMLISGPSAGMGSQPDLGKVNGEEISMQEFNRVENLVYSGSGGNIYAQRSSLWDFFVENKIVSQYADEMGLNVSVEELKALEFGPNYSPIIIQNFPNPQIPNLPNTQQLNQLRTLLEGGGLDAAIQQNQLAPNFRAIWRHQESLIIKDRLQTKLNSIIEKGLYTPSWMAEDMNSLQNQTISFSYVKVPFDEIENGDVSLTDADYSAYLNENNHLFERKEETRKLTYVTFGVDATPEDTATIKNNIAELAAKFKVAENDTTFVQVNQGIFTGSYLKESQLPASISDSLKTLNSGDVYGPYYEAGKYKAVKVLDRRILPDSVRARHILLRIDQANPAASFNLPARADSIKNAIEAGTTTFEAMNQMYNDDAVAKTDGGDLGYAGLNAMVKSFNDLIYFTAEPNNIYTVNTQFGTHIVEVLGKKFITNEAAYLLAYVEEDVIPSEKTQKARYNEAFAFMTNNRTLDEMTAAAESDPSLTVQTSSAFDANAYQIGFTLPASQSSRDMIKWAFDKSTKIGKVASNVYEFSDQTRYFDNQYLIVALESVLKPGAPKVDELKTDIEPAVLNLKKGEMLKASLAGKSMTEIASTYSTSIDSVSSVSFNSSFIQDIGSEPKLVGEAFKLSAGQTSGPIVGNTGVFMLQVLDKTPAAAAANIPQLRQDFNATARSRVSTQLITALKENAKIKDNRAIFY